MAALIALAALLMWSVWLHREGMTETGGERSVVEIRGRSA